MYSYFPSGKLMKGIWQKQNILFPQMLSWLVDHLTGGVFFDFTCCLLSVNSRNVIVDLDALSLFCAS